MQEMTGDALRTVLDTLDARVAYLDADLRFQYVNAAFAASVGRRAEELIGSEYIQLFSAGEERALLDRALSAREAVLLRAVAWSPPSRPGAETSYWDCKMTAVRNGDTLSGVLLSMTDVTERTEMRQGHAVFMQEMATIREIARQLLSERRMEGLLQRTVDAARHLTRGRVAVVGGIVCCGLAQAPALSREVAVPDGPASDEQQLIERVLDTAWIEGQTSIRLTEHELRQHPAWHSLAEQNALPHGLLCASLTGLDGQPNGLIAIWDKCDGGFAGEDEALLAELASIASLGVQHLEARAEVERRADLLDAVLEAIVDPVLVYDAAGEPIRANAAAIAASGGIDPVGADRAQLLRAFTVTYSDGQPVAIPDLPSNRALRGETVRDEHLIFHPASGARRTIVATARPLCCCSVQDGAVLVWHDLTALQLAQEARDRLLDILEKTPDYIATGTPDGRLLYANRAARQMIDGRKDADVVGRSVLDAHPEWAAKVVLEEAVPTALREGVWRGQTAMLSHDGREIPVSQVVLAHRGPNGEVAYLSTIFRDTSEEQRLLEENRRQRWFLERLMEALPVGIAVVSGPEHRYEYANRHYQLVIHQSEQPLAGRTIHDVLPPRVAERAASSLDEVRRTKMVASRREVEVPATSGEPQYWDIDQVPLLADRNPDSGDDAVERVLILAYEVTDAVRARKELDDQRVRLQAIIDDVPDGIVVLDKEARVALVNRAGERVYGHPLLVGERYDRQPEMPLYTPGGVQYDPRDLPIVRSALDGEVCRDEEMIVVDADGRRRHLLASSSPIRDSAGALDGAVVAYRDITARVELERNLQRHADELDRRVAERTAALHASQARLQALFEGAAVGVGLADGEGQMVECNPTLATITGYSVEELLAMRFADFTHPDDVEADLALLRELMAGERDVYQLEKRYVRKDGETVWVNLMASLIRDGTQPPLAIGIVEDITARKEASEALIQAEKLSAAGRLAASLAHEINNPLQSVIGCLGLAERKLARGEDVAQYIQVARQELRRAARVVAQMRDLHRRSRVGSRERTEISPLLEQVLLVTARQCENQGVGVTLRKPDVQPVVSAVPDQLRQVFLNLVLNAIDAMPDGGLLDVAVSPTVDPRGVSIQFRDSGTGIAPEVLPRLFEPFYSTRAGGLGLGLFISRNIIEDHEGHIELNSTLGQGSAFTVWLPEA
jgi:PAS domain S-box-containing protein